MTHQESKWSNPWGRIRNSAIILLPQQSDTSNAYKFRSWVGISRIFVMKESCLKFYTRSLIHIHIEDHFDRSSYLLRTHLERYTYDSSLYLHYSISITSTAFSYIKFDFGALSSYSTWIQIYRNIKKSSFPKLQLLQIMLLNVEDDCTVYQQFFSSIRKNSMNSAQQMKRHTTVNCQRITTWSETLSIGSKSRPEYCSTS